MKNYWSRVGLVMLIMGVAGYWHSTTTIIIIIFTLMEMCGAVMFISLYDEGE